MHGPLSHMGYDVVINEQYGSSVMNLQRLFLLSEENPQAIDALCAEQGLDPVVARGVVLLMIANDGNIATLSVTQREHYEKAIRPLIE